MWLLAIFIGLAALMAAASKQHRKTSATWGAVAQRLGLQLEPGSIFSSPKLSGSLNGIPLRVDSFSRRHGNQSTTYTRYQVRYPSAGFDFMLKREGGLAKIGHFFGIRDIEVGDPGFDDAFKIQTNDPARLRQLLTPSVRSGLFRLMASFPPVVISEGHIGMELPRLERNPERLESVIRRLVGTAQLLASPSGGVSDQDVTDRQQGMLTEVADRLRQAVEQHPDDVDQRIFEVETLAAAGEEEKADRRLKELETMAPADPDVMGWKQALGTRAAAPAAREVNIDEMAEDLFGGNDLSFETLTKFNSKYVGASVAWEATVKEVRQSTSAVHRVTLTVASVENDLYGNTDIDVIVETTGPPPAKGATVTVSGILDRIDPLVRNLYLATAKITP